MFLADQPGGTGAAAVLRLLGRQRQKYIFGLGRLTNRESLYCVVCSHYFNSFV